MSVAKWWWWVIVLILIGLIIAILKACQPPGPTTKLIVEITGGFAYVPESDGHLSIGYLNDVRLTEDLDTNGDGVVDVPNAVVCEVDQVGTQLMVLRGTITVAEKTVPATPPPTKIFDLDKAVLTFPALETAGLPLTAVRQPWPPAPVKPADPNDEKQWKLQYVPRIKEHHPGTTLKNGWPGLLNGRMVLRGGTIRATYPSDPMIQQTDFEFKKGGSSLGKAAVTDKTIYEVDVPGKSIEILFSNAASGFTRIVIEPAAANAPVRLRLRGLHAKNTPASHANGDELKDFCSFYSLLEPTTLPKSKDWLRLHYMAPPLPPTASLVGGGQPSPGFFCNGDF